MIPFLLSHWEVVSSIGLFVLSEVLGVLPIKSSGVASLAVNAAKKALGKESPKKAVEEIRDEAVKVAKEKLSAEAKRFEGRVNAEMDRVIGRIFDKK